MHTQTKTEHTPNWQSLASNIAGRIKQDDPLALAELNQLCAWAAKFTPAVLGYDPTQQKETRAAAPDLLGALLAAIPLLEREEEHAKKAGWVHDTVFSKESTPLARAKYAIARATGEEK